MMYIMSKYSFISTEVSDPNKQCFCIDINNSNTPFTYATQINSAPSSVPAVKIGVSISKNSSSSKISRKSLITL